MMSATQWTAQEVERFREQQRWRLRQKSNQPPTAMYRQCQQLLAPPAPVNSSWSELETRDRTRKVSLKFRREHNQFLTKPQMPSHLSALAVALRPTFATPKQPRRSAESPLPHTDHLMFNAFDSSESPEAFSLDSNQHDEEQEQEQEGDDQPRSHGSEQRQHHGTLHVDLCGDSNSDHLMSDGEETPTSHRLRDAFDNSLWRRRFYVPGAERRSPKLGQVALWDASTVGGYMHQDNQMMELQRIPLPFDDDL